jgi:hypothetical protein
VSKERRESGVGQWLCVSHRGVSAHIPAGARPAALYELQRGRRVRQSARESAHRRVRESARRQRGAGALVAVPLSFPPPVPICRTLCTCAMPRFHTGFCLALFSVSPCFFFMVAVVFVESRFAGKLPMK